MHGQLPYPGGAAFVSLLNTHHVQVAHKGAHPDFYQVKKWSEIP